MNIKKTAVGVSGVCVGVDNVCVFGVGVGISGVGGVCVHTLTAAGHSD